ncbi:hypothetical protein CW304_29320 [Bacillus sp. UFRGS-B20]|nr:hypothetical protein CW304_29320 [Bacillus sp. UFRGS-B20]
MGPWKKCKKKPKSGLNFSKKTIFSICYCRSCRIFSSNIVPLAGRLAMFQISHVIVGSSCYFLSR